jgi:hypothetical protein
VKNKELKWIAMKPESQRGEWESHRVSSRVVFGELNAALETRGKSDIYSSGQQVLDYPSQPLGAIASVQRAMASFTAAPSDGSSPAKQ